MSIAQPSIRHAWIDRARGLAAFLVILFHSGYHAAKLLPPPAWLETFNVMAAPFRMPLLMLVAGLFLERALSKGAASLIKLKLRHLLWPFVVWTVLLCLATGTPEKLLTLKIWRGGGTYLWFLVFLFAYFLVAVLVRRAHHLAVALVALAIAVAAEDGSKYGERLFVLMAYFFVGGFLGQHLERLTALLADRRTLLLAPCVAVVAIASLRSGSLRYSPLWFALIVPGLVWMFAVLQQLPASSLMRGAEYMGRRSMVFYVVNTPVYMLADPLLMSWGLSAPVLIGTSLLLALSLATFVASARERNAWLAPLFEFPVPAGARKRATCASVS